MSLKTNKYTFSWLGVIVFSAVACILLLILFPKKVLLNNILHDKNSSPLTIIYLKDLIKHNPDNTQYKISLIQQEISLGHLNIAKQLLEQYKDFDWSSAERWTLQFLSYKIHRIETFALKSHTAKRIDAEQTLKKLLMILQQSPNLSGSDAILLGDDALAMNEPAVALSFYQQVLKKQHQLPVSFYAKVGQAGLYVSDYQTSASFYLLALKNSKSIDKQQLYFMKAMDSFRAGKQFDKALVLLPRYDKLINNKSTLMYVINLALNANQPALAEQYASRLWMLLSKNSSGNIQPPVYDEALYDLVYKVYLFNGHIDLAFEVAMAAVTVTQSDSKTNRAWRERLADVAIWNKKLRIAIEQYLILVKKYQDQNALKKGIEMTTQMQDDEFLMRFLLIAIDQNPQEPVLAEQLINTWLRLGDIAQAVGFVKQHKTIYGDSFYWLSMARISRLVSDIDAQLFMLEHYTKQYPITSTIAIEMAKIYVERRQLKKAAQVLFAAKEAAMHEAKNVTPQRACDERSLICNIAPQSVISPAKLGIINVQLPKKLDIFWDAYASIAKAIGNIAEEQFAYRQLLKYPDFADLAYSNLMVLYGQLHPQMGYYYAQLGKKRFPNRISFAIAAFSWAMPNSAWSDFPKLDANLPDAIRKQLHYNLDYDVVKANYLQTVGQHDAAVKVFWDNINVLTTHAYLKADFIYFLIHTFDFTRLRNVLSLWSKSGVFSQALWGTYAEGFYQLNNRAMFLPALQKYYDVFKEYAGDPYWMIGFKDMLDSVDYPQQSWAVTHYAWSIYLPLLAKQQAPLDYTQLLDYLKLSLQEAPGDPSGMGLSVLQHNVNPDVELLMLTWAISNNNIALADAIYRYYQLLNIIPPAWAELSLALRHADRYLMRKLLTDGTQKTTWTPPKISSYRDKIQAAQAVDNLPLAQKTAFESLDEHPHDSAQYDHYFTPVMLKTASKFSVSQEYYQYADVEGPRNVVSYGFSPTPSLRVKPYHFIWFSNQLAPQSTQSINQSIALSSQDITNVPSYDDRVGVQVNLAQYGGDLIVDLARRKALDTFATVRMQRQYQVFHDLNTVLDLGFHQLAEDSLGLLVGGMKNDVHLAANYALTAHDALLGDYFQNFFYTQDNKHVANGYQITGNLEHRFNLAYPDWTIGLYGTTASYFNKVDQLSGKILTLIPQGVPNTVNFLIPSAFMEYGIRGSFGESLVDDYSHAWRPFGALTVSNNTSVGFGTLFDVGVTGCVFGRDKLLLYYNQGTNQGAGIQLQRLVKMTYSMYF